MPPAGAAALASSQAGSSHPAIATTATTADTGPRRLPLNARTTPLYVTGARSPSNAVRKPAPPFGQGPDAMKTVRAGLALDLSPAAGKDPKAFCARLPYPPNEPAALF